MCTFLHLTIPKTILKISHNVWYYFKGQYSNFITYCLPFLQCWSVCRNECTISSSALFCNKAVVRHPLETIEDNLVNHGFSHFDTLQRLLNWYVVAVTPNISRPSMKIIRNPFSNLGFQEPNIHHFAYLAIKKKDIITIWLKNDYYCIVENMN